MLSLFRWFRNQIRDAVLGGLADADQVIAAQVNGHAETPVPVPGFLVPPQPQPAQALPAPEAVTDPEPVAVPVPVPVPGPLPEPVPADPSRDLRQQALALSAEGKAAWEIGRKLKVGTDQVKAWLREGVPCS